jgi:hypothetical protein
MCTTHATTHAIPSLPVETKTSLAMTMISSGARWATRSDAFHNLLGQRAAPMRHTSARTNIKKYAWNSPTYPYG